MDTQIIQDKIYEIRGQRVMLDFDLATMYQVPTKALKQAVKRNAERFPSDFMFQLTDNEWLELVTNCDRLPKTLKHSSIIPTVFTQEGVASLAGVLRSVVAIDVYIAIMRAFVQMRSYLVQSNQLSAELAELRSRLQLVERDSRDNLEAVNDLSEDLRKDIDTIYQALGALSVKLPQAQSIRSAIGFKTK